MKSLSRILFSLFIMSSISYAMHLEEEKFQRNLAQLNAPLVAFVNDFKAWSQEEKDKISTYRSGISRGIIIQDIPAASNKYNGSIGDYLSRLPPGQIEPFLEAIDYLKNKK